MPPSVGTIFRLGADHLFHHIMNRLNMGSRSLLWAFGLTGLFLLAGMILYLWDLNPNPIAAQLTFSRCAFKAVICHWSDEQVGRFRNHFTVDYLFLTVYGTWGWMVAHKLERRGRLDEISGFLAGLLPVAAVLDGLENLLHQTFLASASHVPDGAYFLAGVVSLCKWSLIAAFGLLAAWMLRRNAAQPACP